MHSVGGVLRIYLCLLPLSLAATYSLLLADRMTAETASDLTQAGFGWPFNWVTQDLSRYQPASFPTTIDFNYVRVWDDPIATSYDWLMLAVNAVIVGIGVTAALYMIAHVVKLIRSRKRPGTEAPPAGEGRPANLSR